MRSVLAGNIRYAGTPAAVNYAESKLFDDDTNTVWCSADNALPVFLDVFFVSVVFKVSKHIYYSNSKTVTPQRTQQELKKH